MKAVARRDIGAASMSDIVFRVLTAVAVIFFIAVVAAWIHKLFFEKK